MELRNMVYTGPMMETEIQHANIHPEPYGVITSFPQPRDHPGPVLAGITFMVVPPGDRVVPVPINPNQLVFPNQAIIAAFKGKIPPVNFQHFFPAPGSNSFVVGYVAIPVTMGPGNQRGARNRAAGDAHRNHGPQFMPMSHGVQPLQVVPPPWLNQQFRGNAPSIPYMQVYANGYQLMTANGNPVFFVHAAVGPHPLPPPMSPLRVMDFHLQLALTPRTAPLRNGVDFLPRFVGPAPPIGVRVYRPHRPRLMVGSTSRRRGLPRLRVLPQDGVAMLDISNYGHRVDHHRDMRLDIDHMSYEELVALGERIGNADSGLAEEFILGHLKTKTFSSSDDQEVSFCTICQTEYSDQEKMGILDCSHKYHEDCIKKWLVVKNTCPVCKCTGLATQGNQSEEP